MRKADISIISCTRREFERYAEIHQVKPWYGIKYLRGFFDPQRRTVYVVDGCAGFLGVVAHEVGHALGYDHSAWPGIMNFSGLFRWAAYTPGDVRAFLGAVRGALAKLARKDGEE